MADSSVTHEVDRPPRILHPNFGVGAPPSKRWPAPWLFFFLVMPYGIVQGFVQTPLPVLLRQFGVTTGEIATIVAFITLPTTLNFLWGPIVDFLLPRRTWMVLATAATAALFFIGILQLHSHINLARWLLFLGFATCTMTSACCGGLMASTLTSAEKGKAAGWYNAGSLGASAVGGGVLLFFAERLPLIGVSLIAAAMLMLMALPALTIKEAPPQNSLRQLEESISGIWREVRETVFHWKAVPSLLLILAPLGTGAAIPLFASMAGEYRVTPSGVMLLNGFVGALLIVSGSLLATLIPSQWDRRLNYAFAGGINGLGSMAMVLLPMHASVYYVCVSLYFVTTGVAYTCFTALVLHMLGTAGRSGSSRYTILLSLANIPCVFMTWFEGVGYRHFGAKGVPGFDAAGNVAVCVVVIGLALFFRSTSITPLGDVP